MAAVRLAQMPASDDVAQLLGRLDALERRLGGGSDTGSAGGAPPAESRGSRQQEARTPRRGAPEAAPPGAGAPLSAVFDRLRAFVREQSPAIHAALGGGRLVEQGESGLRIAVAERFAADRLREKSAQLEEIASRFFGRPTPVRIELDEGAQPDAGDGATQADPEALRRRRQAAINDPGVGRALEIMRGEILEIRPLGGGR